jgi:hypothetical protein
MERHKFEAESMQILSDQSLPLCLMLNLRHAGNAMHECTSRLSQFGLPELWVSSYMKSRYMRLRIRSKYRTTHSKSSSLDTLEAVQLPDVFNHHLRRTDCSIFQVITASWEAARGALVMMVLKVD